MIQASGTPVTAVAEPLPAPAAAPLARTYVVLVAAVEVALGFGPPVAAVAAASALITLLVNDALFRSRLREELEGDGERSDPTADAASALLLLPLITLVARAASIPGPPLASVALVGSVTFAAVCLLMRPAPLRSIGALVRWGGLLIGGGALLVGLLALLLAGRTLAASTGGVAAMAAWWLVLVVFVGFVGELVLRVLVQTALACAFGSRGIVATAGLSAAFGASLGSLHYAALLGVSALLFGRWVDETESIAGASLASGTLHAALLLLGPALR